LNKILTDRYIIKIKRPSNEKYPSFENVDITIVSNKKNNVAYYTEYYNLLPKIRELLNKYKNKIIF